MSSDEWVGFEVCGVPVYCEVEGLSQVRFGSVEFDFDGLEAVLGVFQLGADPVLFGLEQLEGDSIGVVGFEELASFVFECAYAAFLNEVFFFGCVALVD